MSSQWHLHIISRPSTTSEISSQLKVYPPLWCLTMALHSLEMNSKVCLRIQLHAHHIITSFPPVQLFHQGHGEESQECLQENWWVSKCSSKSTISAIWHPYLDRSSFPSWNTSWMTSTRKSHFKTLKTDQHMSDSADTHWNTEHTEGTVWQNTSSKGSIWVLKQVQFFPNKQGTGPVTWLTGTVTEILDWGHSYMIQGPTAESTGEMGLNWSPFVMMAPHSTLHICHPKNHQLSPTQGTLHLQAGRDISLNQPSLDPMTLTEDSHSDFQLYCKEMSPLAPHKLERSAKARARQAFSTMHWTPFKTPLRKVGNWCMLTHFKTLTHTAKVDFFQDLHSGHTANHQKLTHFKTLCSYAAHNPFVLTPFKTLVNNHQIDSFQDPILIYSTKLFKLTPFKTIALDYIVFSFSMGDTLQIDSVIISMGDYLQKIGSFRTISYGESWTHPRPLHHIKQCFQSPWETSPRKLILSGQFYSEFQIPFKTHVTHTSHSVNGLISRPFGRGKERQSTWQYSFSDLLDSFQYPTSEIKKTQDN